MRVYLSCAGVCGVADDPADMLRVSLLARREALTARLAAHKEESKVASRGSLLDDVWGVWRWAWSHRARAIGLS